MTKIKMKFGDSVFFFSICGVIFITILWAIINTITTENIEFTIQILMLSGIFFILLEVLFLPYKYLELKNNNK